MLNRENNLCVFCKHFILTNNDCGVILSCEMLKHLREYDVTEKGLREFIKQAGTCDHFEEVPNAKEEE